MYKQNAINIISETDSPTIVAQWLTREDMEELTQTNIPEEKWNAFTNSFDNDNDIAEQVSNIFIDSFKEFEEDYTPED